MFSSDTLISYPDWKLTYTVHTDASVKQLGYFISQNNKPIDFFYRILSKPQRNNTTTEKELYNASFHNIFLPLGTLAASVRGANI